MKEYVCNKVKLFELAQHILDRVQECTINRLYDTLYFIDFGAYRELGEPITGDRYTKNERGFTAESLSPAALESAQTTDLSVFSSEELTLIDRLLANLDFFSDEELTRKIQAKCGWRVAHLGEHVPYCTALLPDQPIPLSAKELEWAKGVAENWLADITPAPGTCQQGPSESAEELLK